MRKRLIRATVFIAVVLGVAVGAANAAGAADLGGQVASTAGIIWD